MYYLSYPSLSHKKTTPVGRLLFIIVSQLLIINILVTFILTLVSVQNYPGGQALARFHDIYSQNQTFRTSSSSSWNNNQTLRNGSSFQPSLTSTSRTSQPKPAPRSSSNPTRLLTPCISPLRLPARGPMTKPNCFLSEPSLSPRPSRISSQRRIPPKSKMI